MRPSRPLLRGMLVQMVLALALALAPSCLGAEPATGPVSAPSSDGLLLESLALDDACLAAGGQGAGCGVELLQLRAQRGQRAVVAEEDGHRVAASEAVEDGRHRVQVLEAAGSLADGRAKEEETRIEAELKVAGEKMWKGPTWESVLAEVSANASADAGTDASAEATCPQDSGGTCSVFGCAATRGAVKCQGGKCLCAPGTCARGGTCLPKTGHCPKDTGGSCWYLGCGRSRGQTTCSKGKCRCKSGSCAWSGRCLPVTDTGGGCSVLPCSASRGPTVCQEGRCLCQYGHVAVAGKCELERGG